MRFYLMLLFVLPVYCIGQKPIGGVSFLKMNQIANDYVRLGLSIGQYDGDFVDAYYGPDSLKPTTPKQAFFPKDSFLRAVDNLKVQLRPYESDATDQVIRKRAMWIESQLTAFSRRIKMFSGEQSTFEIQAKELFGVEPPKYSEEHFKSLLRQLEKILPGEGPVVPRFQNLANRFIIPKEKVDTVVKTAIAESKRRTKKYIQLPDSEDFRIEYVTGKPWAGYNWYLGNFRSLIQFNSESTSFVDRMIDVASHEGYPGHHVYNSLLEKNLFKDKGWPEISLYPLYSPQSLIAEGSANYGIEVAFPQQEKIKFIRENLLPLAGLDTAGLTTYFQALVIKGELSNVRTEICRRLLNGKMTDDEAIRWTVDYALLNENDATHSLSFVKKYQSYVINYTYGKDLVKNYIEGQGGSDDHPARRWTLFKILLSNETRPADLIAKARE